MFKVSKELLKEYATLAIEDGIKVQKGQPSDICAANNAIDVVKGKYLL